MELVARRVNKLKETGQTRTIRRATNEEMEAIYKMGFDVWGEGDPMDTYLQGCRSSVKYKRGHWYVLADAQGALISSMITYELGHGLAGIGSIATPRHLRKRGFASRLIQGVLQLLLNDGFKTVFLFANIAPEFYEKFGFKKLPKKYQAKKDSTCMVWGQSIESLIEDTNFSAPAYF